MDERAQTSQEITTSKKQRKRLINNGGPLKQRLKFFKYFFD